MFCPGFAVDCLETLEEIAVENKHYFIDAGGTSYNYIPALNASPPHIHALAQLIERQIADWLAMPLAQQQAQQRQKRFEAMRDEQSVTSNL